MPFTVKEHYVFHLTLSFSTKKRYSPETTPEGYGSHRFANDRRTFCRTKQKNHPLFVKIIIGFSHEAQSKLVFAIANPRSLRYWRDTVREHVVPNGHAQPIVTGLFLPNS